MAQPTNINKLMGLFKAAALVDAQLAGVTAPTPEALDEASLARMVEFLRGTHPKESAKEPETAIVPTHVAG